MFFASLDIFVILVYNYNRSYHENSEHTNNKERKVTHEEIMALPVKAEIEVEETDKFLGESEPIGCDEMMNTGHEYQAYARPSTGERFRVQVFF